MSWAEVVALIIKFGIDQAYRIWKIAKEGPPDDAAWEKLKALSLKSYDDYIAEAKVRAAHKATLALAENGALPPINKVPPT